MHQQPRQDMYDWYGFNTILDLLFSGRIIKLVRLMIALSDEHH